MKRSSVLDRSAAAASQPPFTPPSEIDQLRLIPIFADWQPQELADLARRARRRQRGPGELVLVQDEPGSTAFVILSGTVDVLLLGSDGREFRLARLGTGDHFGEMALIDPEPRSATIQAVTSTELLVLAREDVLATLQMHPGALLHMLATLSRRLRHTDRQVGSLAFEDVASRLSRFLRLNAQQGPFGLSVDLTQAELATVIGTTRQTIARTFQSWRELGWIATSRRRTVLLQPEALAHLSER